MKRKLKPDDFYPGTDRKVSEMTWLISINSGLIENENLLPDDLYVAAVISGLQEVPENLEINDNLIAYTLKWELERVHDSLNRLQTEGFVYIDKSVEYYKFRLAQWPMEQLQVKRHVEEMKKALSK